MRNVAGFAEFAAQHPGRLAASLYFEWGWLPYGSGIYGAFPFCGKDGAAVTGETAGGRLATAPME